MILLGSLPILVFFTTVVLIWSPTSSMSIRRDARLALLSAYVAVVAATVLFAELSSLFSGFREDVVLTAWAVACLACAACAFRTRRLSALLKTTGSALSRSWIATTVVVGGALVLLITGLLTPPNNYDSVTYRLARMETWIEHHSLANFPTANQRQIEFGPLSSILIANLKLLTNSDLFFNSIQLSALLFAVLPSASWIAEQLGAKPGARQVLAVALITSPMIILQASSTQDDLLVSGFLLSVAALGWVLWREPNWISAVLLGLSAGCAIATKGTALAFGLPLGLWWTWHAVRRGPRLLIRPALIAGVAMASVCFWYLARNYSLTKTSLGEVATEIRPSSTSFTGSAATLLKNLSLEVATPSQTLNGALERSIRGFLTTVLRVDPDDPRENFAKVPFGITSRWRHEDHAGNPVQALLIVGTAIGVLVGRRRRNPSDATSSREGAGLGVVLVLSLVLFSTILMWQIWGSRLLTPLLCLGLVWASSRWRISWSTLGIIFACGTLAALASPWLLLNESRPLLGRTHSVLLRTRDSQQIAWEARARQFQELRAQLETLAPANVGFQFDFETPEYPIQRVILSRPGPPEFFHIGVSNVSAVLNRRTSAAALVISSQTFDERCRIDGHDYARIWKGDGFALYQPVSAGQ